MAIIRPFCAVQYNSSQVDLKEVTFIQGESNFQKEVSDYHIKQILEPKSSVSARSKFVKYAQSSALLNEWKRKRIFLIEQNPAYYIYEQRPTNNLSSKNICIHLLCLLKMGESIQEGISNPSHFSMIDEKLRLLESTYAHFEPVTGVYDDPNEHINQMLIETKEELEPISIVSSLDGIEHRIYKINQPIESFFQDKKIWIIKNFNSYAAALKLQSTLTPRNKERPTDYVLANLVSSQSLDLGSLCSISEKEEFRIPELKIGLLFWSLFDEMDFKS